jgi:hypothetical protein
MLIHFNFMHLIYFKLIKVYFIGHDMCRLFISLSLD